MYVSKEYSGQIVPGALACAYVFDKGMKQQKTENTEMNKKTGKNDLFLILALLGIGLLLGLFLLVTKKDGKQVQVRVDGTVVAVYPLDQELTLTLTGYRNGTNQLEIHQGKAWIREASCPDGLCVNMGKISSVGQSVVCLPNHLVMEVVSETGDSSPDGVDLVAR